MAAAALAMAVANSAVAPAHLAVLGAHLGPLSIPRWVNDALMAIFLLLVGLEIKREFVDVNLSVWRTVAYLKLCRMITAPTKNDVRSDPD